MNNDNSKSQRRISMLKNHLSSIGNQNQNQLQNGNGHVIATSYVHSSSSSTITQGHPGDYFDEKNNGNGNGNGKKFRYTMDGTDILTKEQREQYERDGFIVIPKLLSDEKIDRWIEHFRELARDPSKRMESMTVVRDVALSKRGISKEQANSEELITKFQDFLEDEVFFEFAKDPEVLKYIEAFTGPNDGIQAMHSMLINKPPDTGIGSSRHPMHQDHWYFPWKPEDRTVACWVAMQDINEENGCLQVVPGSHKTELLLHGYPEGTVNKAYHQILGLNEESMKSAIKCIMGKGDAVFFHPLLWHGSGPNYSKGYRKAISMHYASTACKYISVKGTIQEVIDAEVKDIVRIRLKGKGIEATDEMLASLQYADLWKAKSRLVKGDEVIQDA